MPGQKSLAKNQLPQFTSSPQPKTKGTLEALGLPLGLSYLLESGTYFPSGQGSAAGWLGVRNACLELTR